VKLSIQSFGGIAPRIRPRYLAESQAQVAENCTVDGQSLRPLNGFGSTLLTLAKSGTIESLYRFGQSVAAGSRPTQYWFHWTEDVDVCRGQIAGDPSEWTFYTGETFSPKATYNNIALTGGGTAYPLVSRDLGLPAPTGNCTATVDAAALPDGESLSTAVYVYTWVATEAGLTMESPPSPASASVDFHSASTITVDSFDVVPTGNYNITHKRIYRSVAGTYFYVGEILAAATSFVDTNEPDFLGEELPTLTWSNPPSGLRGLTNLPNGVMAGFVTRDVYFCDPYHPYAWPTGYMQSLDYPVVGLGTIDTTLVALTTGVPYLIQGSHPDSMVVVESDIRQACVSKRSIVSMAGSVFYASPDGLVRISAGGSQVVTDEIMTREQWQALSPSTIHAYGHDNKYIGFYDTGAEQGSFILDLSRNTFAMSDLYAVTGYVDLQDDSLYLVNADKTLVEWGVGAVTNYVWRSKKFTMPRVVSFAAAEVDAEAYPVTAKFYIDSAVAPFYTQTVASRLPFRLPVAPGLEWEVQLEGSVEVFAVNLGSSMGELSSV
jgi:hypothetical protein